MLRAACLVLAVILGGCAKKEPEKVPALELAPVAWTKLPGWSLDDPGPALRAFKRSCESIGRRAADAAFGQEPVYGKIGDWQGVCAAAATVEESRARAFFEERFTPFAVSDSGSPEGLFTGYYEPQLAGSRIPDERFRHPLHKRPTDLVTVDLAMFDKSLEGRRIAGKIEGGRLVPYPDRAEIDAGALKGRKLELLWVADPIDKFFLQIQGSGQVVLPDGGIVRVGYADQNGHPYRAIGRDLIEMGELTRENVSMQSIRDWLDRHPEAAPALMAKNASYVFFRELQLPADAEGPPGAQGVPLTPGRSVAVDRRFLPLGLPVWLDTTAPWPAGERPLRRLFVAQDTGGAIKGVVRADVFWGAGPEAAHVAGHMKSSGRYWVLLPKEVVPRT